MTSWMRGAMGLVVVLAFLVLSGCASSTLIESRPAGATVVLEGDLMVGETPVRVRDLPGARTRRTYEFSKEGYHPRVIELAGKTHSRHLLACLCSMGMLWPLMLFSEYPSGILIELERDNPAPRAEFRADPQINFGPQ